MVVLVVLVIGRLDFIVVMVRGVIFGMVIGGIG